MNNGGLNSIRNLKAQTKKELTNGRLVLFKNFGLIGLMLLNKNIIKHSTNTK